MWLSGPITTVHYGHICQELAAVARVGLATRRWLSDKSRSAAVVLGNHPISVRWSYTDFVPQGTKGPGKRIFILSNEVMGLDLMRLIGTAPQCCLKVALLSSQGSDASAFRADPTGAEVSPGGAGAVRPWPLGRTLRQPCTAPLKERFCREDRLQKWRPSWSSADLRSKVDRNIVHEEFRNEQSANNNFRFYSTYSKLIIVSCNVNFS